MYQFECIVVKCLCLVCLITKFLVSYTDKGLFVILTNINCASTVNFEWRQQFDIKLCNLRQHPVLDRQQFDTTKQFDNKKMELTAETSVFKTYENFVIYLASLK